MFEKVNPAHPDKIADRIAGAIVDLAYTKARDPKAAVEVLIGHGLCTVIVETSEAITKEEIETIVCRIAGDCVVESVIVPQDPHLAKNQEKGIRCGDNGIFCGAPVTKDQRDLAAFARQMFEEYNSDGKYIINGDELIVCQSNAWSVKLDEEARRVRDYCRVNPLGHWTGGTGADSGATNRKLGSDMGDAVTGGGLHGKDLSKADVSVNIYAHLLAQDRNEPVRLCCAIGDEEVGGLPFYKIVEIARKYIQEIGGFEKFAEWGLIR